MRHVLTLQEQIRGIRSALRSRATPDHLRDGLRRHLKELERRANHNRTRIRRGRPRNPRASLLDWLAR
jgi:hypothetical protein